MSGPEPPAVPAEPITPALYAALIVEARAARTQWEQASMAFEMARVRVARADARCSETHKALTAAQRSLLEHADALDSAWSVSAKPMHVGGEGYAAVPIEPGIVHDPHCCAARGCHGVCSHLCGTDLATHGCCGTEPWSVVTDAGLGVFLKRGDTIVAQMTRADSAVLAESMAAALNRAEDAEPRS